MQSVVQIQTSSAMFARRAAQTFACSSAVLELQQARAEVARPLCSAARKPVPTWRRPQTGGEGFN